MAVESDKVTVTTFEATEFPEMIERYAISGVPKTVVNERIEILGALPEAQFVPQALATDGSSHGGGETETAHGSS